MNKLIPCLAVLALSLGCAGPEVHFDYDARATFQNFHSYDWYAPSREDLARAHGVQDPLMDTRVRRAVEAELATRKFRKETSGDPDLLVTYYPVFEPRGVSRGHVGIGLGFGVMRGVGLGVGVGGPVARVEPRTSSIVLEIREFRSHTLVWKARADEVLEGNELPEDAEDLIAKAVQKMLNRFPPAKAI